MLLLLGLLLVLSEASEHSRLLLLGLLLLLLSEASERGRLLLLGLLQLSEGSGILSEGSPPPHSSSPAEDGIRIRNRLLDSEGGLLLLLLLLAESGGGWGGEGGKGL